MNISKVIVGIFLSSLIIFFSGCSESTGSSSPSFPSQTTTSAPESTARTPEPSAPVPESTATPRLSGTDLVFKTIVDSGQGLGSLPGGLYVGPYEGKNPQIVLISANATLPADNINAGQTGNLVLTASGETSPAKGLDWVRPENLTSILSVDYSNYVVILAFNGWKPNIYNHFDILRIYRQSDVVFINAHFSEYESPTPQTVLPAYNSQYEAVRISKGQIGQKGPVTFILTDEKGTERAKLTAEIR
jgi:hypothetical protein